jgi:hypothetical protein
MQDYTNIPIRTITPPSDEEIERIFNYENENVFNLYDRTKYDRSKMRQRFLSEHSYEITAKHFPNEM